MKHRGWRVRGWRLPGAVAVLLASVGSSQAAPPACPAPEFLAPPHPAVVTRTTPARVHVLIDGSGSMAGYFAPGQTNNHYRTLLRQLREDVSDLWGPSVPVDMSRFGLKLTALRPEDEEASTTARFYGRHCGMELRGGCDNAHSVIGLALHEAERQPLEDLTLVFTDLFLTNDAALAEGADSLKDPLYRVLSHGGRSVAVLGIESAFQGTIYDIPNAPDYLHVPRQGGAATTRPVFVIMIGKGQRILQFYQALRGPFLEDLHDQQRFAFYGADWSAPTQSLTWSLRDGVVEDHHEPRLGLPVYKVSRSHYEPLLAPIDTQGLRTRYGTVFDSWSVRETLWTGRERGGCEVWDRLSDAPSLAAVRAVGGQLQVRVGENAALLRHLPAAYLYALQIEVMAGAVGAPGSEDPLKDWNLDPDQIAATLQRHPRFFPALNLATVIGFLDRTSRQRFQPLVVARNTVVLSLD